MERGVWRFVRGADSLEIKLQDLDDGIVLAIAGDGEPRSYFFRDIDRLETFQKDMETLLLKTGWTFASYEPDQRAGRDRRGWPRRANDRRRWWTDGESAISTKPAMRGSSARKPESDEQPRRSEK
jgi:hypothetical protein